MYDLAEHQRQRLRAAVHCEVEERDRGRDACDQEVGDADGQQQRIAQAHRGGRTEGQHQRGVADHAAEDNQAVADRQQEQGQGGDGVLRVHGIVRIVQAEVAVVIVVRGARVVRWQVGLLEQGIGLLRGVEVLAGLQVMATPVVVLPPLLQIVTIHASDPESVPVSVSNASSACNRSLVLVRIRLVRSSMAMRLYVRLISY